MPQPCYWRYYGQYTNSNYGLHCLAFTDAEGNSFYFSYNTLVAFKPAISKEVFCLKNYWSVTTGKHLNAIQPDHKKRIDQEEFDNLYQSYFNKKGGITVGNM